MLTPKVAAVPHLLRGPLYLLVWKKKKKRQWFMCFAVSRWEDHNQAREVDLWPGVCLCVCVYRQGGNALTFVFPQPTLYQDWLEEGVTWPLLIWLSLQSVTVTGCSFDDNILSEMKRRKLRSQAYSRLSWFMWTVNSQALRLLHFLQYNDEELVLSLLPSAELCFSQRNHNTQTLGSL